MNTRAEDAETEVVLSGAIMTHPVRAQESAVLAKQLVDVQQVVDPDPASDRNPLRTARAAWMHYSEGATHHVVLQDDVIIADDFLDHVKRAVRSRPDACLSFFAAWNFANGAAVRLGVAAGFDFVERVEWGAEHFPTQATVLPVNRIPEYLDLSRELGLVQAFDNQAICDFIRSSRIPAYISSPSLVEHGDHESIMGHYPRQAACFADHLPVDDQELRYLDSPYWLPHLFRGTCYILMPAVLADGTRCWKHYHWESQAAALGFPVSEITRKAVKFCQLAPPMPTSQKFFVKSVWTSGYLIAAAAAQRPDSAVRKHDDPVLLSALRTLIPGGSWDSRVEHSLSATVKSTAQSAAVDGFHAALNY